MSSRETHFLYNRRVFDHSCFRYVLCSKTFCEDQRILQGDLTGDQLNGNFQFVCFVYSTAFFAIVSGVKGSVF